MEVFFERLQGDNFKFNTTQPDFDVAKVKSTIANLSCYKNSYVVVDLQAEDVDKSLFSQDMPMFFQCIRDKHFGKTHLYHWELGEFCVEQKCNVLYEKDGTLDQLLSDLDDCLAGKPLQGPILRDFAISDSDSTNQNRCQAIIGNYYNKIVKGEYSEWLYFDAQRYLMYQYEGYVDEDDFINLLNDYYEQGKFDKISRLFQDASSKVSISLYRGDIEFYSATPNYQKAYEYYSHAEVLGSLKARYKIAQMYRFGLGVDKDVDKCYHILQEVERLCRQDISSHELLAKVTLALVQIEKERGEIDSCVARLVEMVWWEKDGFMSLGADSKDFLFALNMLEQIDADYVDCEVDKIVLALQRPCNVVIEKGRKKYNISSFYDNNKLIVRSGNKHFNGVKMFVENSKFDGKHFYDKFMDAVIWEVQYV